MDLVAAGDGGAPVPTHEDHGGHGSHDHGELGEHGGRGGGGQPPGIEPHFMSMADLTKGKPVRPDGLIMEWITVPFGPFFPGLPGGLGLDLTLDGDSVAETLIWGTDAATVPQETPVAELADRLADACPLAPVAMRELACRAIEAATGMVPEPATAIARAAAAERERIASHLNWLIGFAHQTGLTSLERRAAALRRSAAPVPARGRGRGNRARGHRDQGLSDPGAGDSAIAPEARGDRQDGQRTRGSGGPGGRAGGGRTAR